MQRSHKKSFKTEENSNYQIYWRTGEMKSALAKRWKMVGLSLLFLALPGWASAQTAFDKIVVFGTSLSDPGNVFALTGEQSTPPYKTLDSLLIPSAPYTKGGHHFSNGATWIEQLAQPLGLSAYVQPAFKGSSAKAANYAVGGARAYNGGLSAQVNAFLQDSGNSAPSDALYVLEFGGNDVRDILASGGDTSILNGALAEISSNIQVLYGAGARKFFIWNVPNISLAPAIQMLRQPAITYAELFSQGFNTGLDAILSGLSALPKIEIVMFDIYDILTNVVSDPGAFGLSVVDAACVTPNKPPFECKTPDDFVFWDGVHPTRAMHAILAQDAAFLLAQ
jgi:phospholipase/lecithinase/hemolysin